MTPTPRRLLLLETSHQPGLVGLALGDRLVARRRLESGRHNARDLAPAVAALLAEQGWAARDLGGVAVGRGPGSYTGLRVGIMSAKTLAYVTGCPLVALDTFAVIAAQSPAECGRIDIIADAQKEAVYVQGFVREGEAWRPADELRVVGFADWLAGRDPDRLGRRPRPGAIPGAPPGRCRRHARRVLVAGPRLAPGAGRRGDSTPGSATTPSASNRSTSAPARPSCNGATESGGLLHDASVLRRLVPLLALASLRLGGGAWSSTCASPPPRSGAEPFTGRRLCDADRPPTRRNSPAGRTGSGPSRSSRSMSRTSSRARRW